MEFLSFHNGSEKVLQKSASDTKDKLPREKGQKFWLQTENTDNFRIYLLQNGQKLHLRLEFLNFLNGSEEVLIRRKNAPVTPKTNSYGKKPKTVVEDRNMGIFPVNILQIGQ